ncbi:hypothetical protein SDC9_204370 [bioreactor metagenome]|uniref:Uncharacterized protein n=1 Tax=bioreactor metagenome TaxID=1076179 RepID=A0A645J0J4_9ZZZZ
MSQRLIQQTAHVRIHHIPEVRFRETYVLRVSSEELVRSLTAYYVRLGSVLRHVIERYLERQGDGIHRSRYPYHVPDAILDVFFGYPDVMPFHAEYPGHIPGLVHIVSVIDTGGVEHRGPGRIPGDRSNDPAVQSSGECDGHGPSSDHI